MNLKAANSALNSSSPQVSTDKTTTRVVEPAFKFSENDEMFVKSIENRDLWMD
jgi:hypothetical protein